MNFELIVKGTQKLQLSFLFCLKQVLIYLIKISHSVAGNSFYKFSYNLAIQSTIKLTKLSLLFNLVNKLIISNLTHYFCKLHVR